MNGVTSAERMRRLRPISTLFLLAVSAAAADAQQVTSPKEQFGHDIGADYVLPNYQQLSAYWRKLDDESQRMLVQEIGKTAEGRPQLMAIITSPDNHRRLARYKEIARRLALAEGVTDETARALANEGRAVVWIDGGLHATEVLGAQQLTETVYQLVSRSDPETLRILNDVVVLAVHANPDGHDLVADWYMRHPVPEKRSTSGLPRLYQKYVGHDNNRDSYLNAMPETENMSRIQFREWFPQIVYNHHQTGPSGSVLFAPPFRDPFNYNMDPLIPAQLDAVGAAMHSRFIREGKPGAVTRRGANYSTWWNGGVRTTVYFHNMIGLLTETIGNPTPISIPFVPRYQLPTSDIFMPIAPQEKWHFRQSVDYSVTANYAVLDYASRHREQLLYNIYLMGRNAIERGSRDNWTPSPWQLEKVRTLMAAERSSGDEGQGSGGSNQGASRYEETVKYYELLRAPELRDARGYILPADQPDFATATKFVNALIKSGIVVQRATSQFAVNGKSYPAGSYVIKTAQAFRAHVLDMFEPQQHPNDFQYPGGPPIAPYDNAGYTLAYQMGVQFDRVQDGFNGPFVNIDGLARTPAGRVIGSGNVAGYTFSHAQNDAFTTVNRLLDAGHDVYWLREPFRYRNKTYQAGTFFVRSKAGLQSALQSMAQSLGVTFEAANRPNVDAFKLRPLRIALWDQYGGSMPSGWMRWLFEQFEFPFEVVYPPMLNAGRLREKYDVIVLPSGSVPSPTQQNRANTTSNQPEHVPEEWRLRMGRVSADTTVPQLREFLAEGGTIITIGSGTALARYLELPIADALVEKAEDGSERRLRREQFYVPGSVLEARLDTTHPLTHGMPERVNVFFDESPVFKLEPQAEKLRRVAWYEKEPLRSGWAWGQQYLENGAAVVEADVGSGKLFMFGPEITFRAQPHGTFKFLFNGIYYGTATPAKVR